MHKPVIMVVDDVPEVLTSIQRDLQAHFEGAYRIVTVDSGPEALEVVHSLKQRNESLALFLVDQRMPEMTGTEFLDQARVLYPAARKVLLTAYADTKAAIDSINNVGLDFYLMKPWQPPAQNLYPVLDDLLDDWIATAPLLYDGIRVAGTQWSASSHHVKDFLARNQIPYEWLDIESDGQARLMVDTVCAGHYSLPVLFFPDGTVLLDPDTRTLAEKVGLQTEASQPFYDLIVVGAGPAGLGAAVSGASDGTRIAVIEREAVGGQSGGSYRIENYLGFPSGISGIDLARRAATQARRFGAEILTAREVSGVRVEDPYRHVTMADGTELTSHALLIATGVSVRELKVPGIDDLLGSGVYYASAVSEAANYRGEHVCVIGGANSAGQAAMLLSRYARKVTLVARASTLEKGMSKYLVDQITDNEKIEVLLRTNMVEVQGDNHLRAIALKNNATDELQTVETEGLFIFIGAVPYSDFVEDVVKRNGAGFIITGQDLMRDGRRPEGWLLKRDPFLLESSVPGIFAAGDVRQGSSFRVAGAVGEGGEAISQINQYLRTV